MEATHAFDKSAHRLKTKRDKHETCNNNVVTGGEKSGIQLGGEVEKKGGELRVRALNRSAKGEGNDLQGEKPGRDISGIVGETISTNLWFQ